MSLIIENVSKNYKQTKALQDVSMVFKEGEITGLIGFNGSGKTTTFNILSNIIEKYRGNVFLEKNEKKIKLKHRDMKLISYLSAGAEPQNQEKSINHFYYLGRLHGLSKNETRLRIREISKILEFENKLDFKIKNLSKGNQQKIKIIAVFINPNAKYILLDEPFDGLDPIMVEKLRKYILERKRKENISIIITSHRMEVVDQICDSFFILKEGVLVEQRTKDDQKNQRAIIVANIETHTNKIKNLKGFVGAEKKPKEIHIEIESIKYFKKIASELLKQKECEWISLRDKKLTESVFERYADDKK